MPYIGRELDRGNYLKLDDISSSFDGSTTTFNLTNGGNAFYPGSAFSILVVLAGVVQEPEAAYQINQTQITFASAPLAGDQFFCIVLGQALGVNTPANGSVNGTQLAKPFNYDNYFYLDDANNRVGVGTATPMTPLHVEGTGRFTNVTVTGDLTVEGTTSTLDTVVTEVDKLEVAANNSTVGVAITQSGSGDILNLYDGSTEVFTVTDGGKVGVGEDNVQAHFHVAKNIADSDAINWTGSQLSIATPIAGNNTANRATIYFAPYGSDNNYAPSAISASAGTNGASTLKFFTNTSGNLTGQVQNYERLRIHSDGKFSFGTGTASAAKYTFNSAGTNEVARFESTDTGAYLAIKDSSSTSINFVEGGGDVLSLGVNSVERLRITTSGVGIGTDNPQSQFEVYGSSPIVRSKHSTSQKYTQINHNGTDGYLDWSSGGLIFRGASNTERLRIDSAGRLLLGSGALALPKGSGAGSFDLDNGSITMCIGGNVNSTGRTNSTDKIARFTAPHYTNAEQPVLIASSYNVSGSNTISYGGGSSLCNSATSHVFYTAADNTTVTGTERLRITSGGLLGLNNTNPQTLLSLRGGYQIGWNHATDGTKYAEIYGDTSSNLIFRNTNSQTERLRITSSGELVSTNGTLRRNVSDGSFTVSGDTASNAGANINLYGASHSSLANVFRVRTGSTERLRITSTGQIGMGKAGAVTPNGNSPLTIQESDSNSETICLRATNSGGNGSQPGIVMKTAAGGHIGGIYCDVNSDYMRLSTSGTDRVFITNTGLVGVNCTPLAQFQVKSGTNANIALTTMSSEASIEAFNDAGSANVPLRIRGSDFKFYTSSTERLLISSDGKVTITTGANSASPAGSGDNLVIKDSNGCGLSILSGNGNSQNIYLGSTSDNDGTRLEGFYNSGSPYFNIYVANTQRLRISSDGLIDASTNTNAVALPQGTTAQRPTGSAPYIRKNTTNNALEYFDGTSWVEIITDYFPTGSVILG